MARGKSHGFSRVAMGTRCTYSSYGGDGHSKPVFVQQRLDSCVVMRDTSGISMRLGRAIRMLLEVRNETLGPSCFHSDIGIPINFQEESGIVTSCSIELRVPLEVSKGCKASCPDEAGTYGFL